MNAKVTGTLYSIDPIFAPDGYAFSVFGEMIDKVTYTTSGRRLDFVVKNIVPFEGVEGFVNRLIPSISEGRKVEVIVEAVTN